MGQKKTDGRAIDVVAPGGQAIAFGELYRIDGFTGIAMQDVAVADTARGLALMCNFDEVWYVSVAAAVNGARGTMAYWTAGAGFKRGTTDLSSTVAGAPVAKVEEARDSNGIVAVKVINAVDVVV